MLRKIALLDEFVWPDLFHEDVLLNQMASTQYEREKGAESFWWQGYQSSVTQQYPLACI